MVSSKVFYNNTTQAVRLPKDVAFSTDVSDVEIIVQGNNRLLVPKGKYWLWWAEFGPRLPEDFALYRDEELPDDDNPEQWFGK